MMDLESIVSGGVGGIGFSAIVGKLFLNSVMDHITTLKTQNAICDANYQALRKDVKELNDKFLKHLGVNI